MKQHRFRTKRKFLLCESVPVDYIGQPRFQIHPFHRTPAYSPPLGIPDHFKQLAALRDGDVVILILRNVGIGHVARPLKQEQRQQGTVDGLVPTIMSVPSPDRNNARRKPRATRSLSIA